VSVTAANIYMTIRAVIFTTWMNMATP
jgi:hypothetical protein